MIYFLLVAVYRTLLPHSVTSDLSPAASTSHDQGYGGYRRPAAIEGELFMEKSERERERERERDLQKYK